MSNPPGKSGNRADEEMLVIRAAEPEDRPRAAAVKWAAGWAGMPTRHREWPEADADWQARRYYREIIGEVDGVIAARVGLEAYRQPFAELADLCVRPDYRRRGLAERLTRECEREAAARGFIAIFLQTELDNQAAHRLYSALDFVPTAHGKMLRMVKFIDYPLLTEFRRTHPLSQYSCSSVLGVERSWYLEWHGYVTNDYLRLRLEGGSCLSDSEGLSPALTGCDWSVGQGARGLHFRFQREPIRDIEPGHHVSLDITVSNHGKRMEAGVFQLILPSGIRVASPATNAERAFTWEVAPGEQITQPVILQVEPTFDSNALWYLNYGSVPVSMEAYWEGHRALLSASLPVAVPPPE